ncbi:phenylacetic acid degradation protein PaaA [Minicystis rosea]|nr:phenylacetic acid degradation protein PaaA [Minicystis rosea]
MDGSEPGRALDRRRTLVVQMMQSQAYRELAAAQMFGHGLRLVPRLEWLKFMTWHIREEMDHYELVARAYRDLTGESVEPFVNARLADKPVPFAESWYELAMAQFLYDRGGYWQLREYEGCSFDPYRTMVGRIVREERGHQAFGERIVVELTRSGEHEAEKQALFERWLRQGLLSFGRPGSEASREAVALGLKKRDPGLVMQDFLDDIKPAVKACGLAFPPLDRIGISEPPGGLDLALDGVDETRAQGYRG